MNQNHGGVQRGPGLAELKAYVSRGLTQKQIAEAWEKETGVRVARSTIGMAMARYGLEPSRPRPRYEDTLPWKVSNAHRMHNDARMLRLEGRRRRGEKLTDREKRWLTQWRQRLTEADAVIVYDADTEEGFFWVARRETDDDILRRGRV